MGNTVRGNWTGIFHLWQKAKSGDPVICRYCPVYIPLFYCKHIPSGGCRCWFNAATAFCKTIGKAWSHFTLTPNRPNILDPIQTAALSAPLQVAQESVWQTGTGSSSNRCSGYGAQLQQHHDAEQNHQPPGNLSGERLAQQAAHPAGRCSHEQQVGQRAQAESAHEQSAIQHTAC